MLPHRLVGPGKQRAPRVARKRRLDSSCRRRWKTRGLGCIVFARCARTTDRADRRPGRDRVNKPRGLRRGFQGDCSIEPGESCPPTPPNKDAIHPHRKQWGILSCFREARTMTGIGLFSTNRSNTSPSMRGSLLAKLKKSHPTQSRPPLHRWPRGLMHSVSMCRAALMPQRNRCVGHARHRRLYPLRITSSLDGGSGRASARPL